MRIDNTQYSAFTRCSWMWYEKYVNKVHRPVEGPRKDALAIGVHVHSALENGYTNNQFVPSDDVPDEYPLTPEASLEVRSMVEYYRQQYPSGPVEFEWLGLESPLELPIDGTDITLVAKVDGFFNVTKACEVADGMGGSIHLEPGIYSFETKTKTPGINRGEYLREWQAAMQATFQLLTLRHHIATMDMSKVAVAPSGGVRGVLVNVIERPKVYTPRKTCQGCKELLPLYTYTIETSGMFRCNNCNHRNQFKPPFPEPRVDPPLVWRFLLERSDARMELDLEHIMAVAGMMANGTMVAHRNECTSIYGKPCEYFEPHNSPTPTQAIDYDGFVVFNPTKYLEPKEVIT